MSEKFSSVYILHSCSKHIFVSYKQNRWIWEVFKTEDEEIYLIGECNPLNIASDDNL